MHRTYQQQEEHSQRNENRNAQRYLLTGVGGQVKHEDGEEGNANAGEDQIDRVEQRFATQVEEELERADYLLNLSGDLP